MLLTQQGKGTWSEEWYPSYILLYINRYVTATIYVCVKIIVSIDIRKGSTPLLSTILILCECKYSLISHNRCMMITQNDKNLWYLVDNQNRSSSNVSTLSSSQEYRLIISSIQLFPAYGPVNDREYSWWWLSFFVVQQNRIILQKRRSTSGLSKLLDSSYI